MNEKEKIINGLNSEKVASDELIELMLKNIGSLCPELRDNTIYIGWVNLEESNKISTKQKLWLIDGILSRNLLFYGIKEQYSDEVFTRSFVSLLLVVLLESHFKNRYIDAETEKEIIKLSIEYMETEKDNRGFVDEKGWAHAFAHGADLLETISKSIYLTPDSATRVLNCISRALINIENFLFGEESRIDKVIISLIKYNKLTQSKLNSWIESNNVSLMESKSFNLCWVKFLMSLSYMLKFEDIEFEETQMLITEYLKFFYSTFEII
ncbi:DUF2785 domain-containing protein [Romboutsia lituseburensis]|uniref:DUF2785 domain-containing protein n=1 Tax=Romboutsia lituseburensis TaxID=1537 RepID=UPI00215A5AAB|nr:DUF2785 domain-containing protein [Romboutsia lituseburensis]MCR8746849.1 DUF2785 domain-containing protein [Romboutsia lituseburensis]